MNKIALSLQVFIVLFTFLLPIKSGHVLAQEASNWETSPKLIRSSINIQSLKVFFQFKLEIEIPSEAQSSLSKIVINQKPDQAEALDIDPEKTQVFLLTDSQPMAIENSTTFTMNKEERTSQTVINLSQAVTPGSKIEIVLDVENPMYKENTYRYEIIVYPEGDNSRSINIGTAKFDLGWREQNVEKRNKK